MSMNTRTKRLFTAYCHEYSIIHEVPWPRPGGRSRTCSAKPHAAVPAAGQRLERTVIRQHGSDSRGQMSDDFSTFDFERTDLRVSVHSETPEV